jgi:hypothetical protein
VRLIASRLIASGILLTAACGGDDDKQLVDAALPACEDESGGAAGSSSPRGPDSIAVRGAADSDEETATKASNTKPATKPAKTSGTAGRGAAGAGGSAGASGEETQEEDEGDLEPGVPQGTDCPDPRTLTPTMKISGTVRFKSSVWKGVVAITGNTEIVETEITIEPGTVILASKGVAVMFGVDGEMTLNAAGTADRPIRFCGADVGSGFWKGVSLADLHPSSTFEHVLIDGAGTEEHAFDVSADIPIKNLRVTNSGSAGIKASLYGEESDDWVIADSAGAPIIFTGVAAVTRFPRNVKFTDNKDEFAIVRIGTLSDEDLIFHEIGMPYLQEGDFVVEGYGGSKLTFEAGVDYQIAVGRKFTVTASPNKQTDFKVMGTEAKPVTFRGSEPAKGSWFGLRVSQVTPTSKISHLVISDAGRDTAYALHLLAEIELQDVTVKNNAKGALFESAPSKSSHGFSAIGNDGYGLEVMPGVLDAIPEGGVFENNEFEMVAIRKGTLSPGVAKNLGVPYHADKLQLDGTLKIEPGTEFVFAKGGAFTVGGYEAPAVLEAVGTSSKMITFRGEDDSNGSWAGLKIASSAGEGCELSYVKLMNAGLTLQRSAEVSNSSFNGSATYGITRRPGDMMTDYTDTNTFSNNTQGDVSP